MEAVWSGRRWLTVRMLSSRHPIFDSIEWKGKRATVPLIPQYHVQKEGRGGEARLFVSITRSSYPIPQQARQSMVRWTDRGEVTRAKPLLLCLRLSFGRASTSIRTIGPSLLCRRSSSEYAFFQSTRTNLGILRGLNRIFSVTDRGILH